MKKLLLSALAIMGMMQSHATHLMGGQITSQNIGGNTYAVTLTVYRDTLGIPISPIAIINYAEVNGTWTDMHTVNVSAPNNYGNGVEEYVYIDTITFPNTGDFGLSWSDCCRNCALMNMTTPCAESFYLENKLYVDPTNSSPVFLNPPIPLAQQGTPFNYNPLPFDIDGDSLYWQLDTPLTSVGLYVTGYTYPYADTSMPFTMNPNTGEVSFMPSTIGYFQASFLVNEYRAGVKIGEIRRDMQIIVVPGLAPPPIVNTTSNAFPYSGKQFYLTPGTSFTMTLTATDNDNRFISVIGNGEPFINGNGATVTTSNGIGGASAVINWTPTANQQRNAAYVAALRVSQAVYNYTFANDYSISLFVGVIPAGINDNSNVKGVSDVYPNPTSGSFNIDYNAAIATSINVKVYDLLGSLIVTKNNININAGINIVSINDANLSKGKYILKIETPNEKPVTRPLTVE